jgi:hypothetical protein
MVVTQWVHGGRGLAESFVRRFPQRQLQPFLKLALVARTVASMSV